MPWMETVPMDERRRFVEACRSRAWTMTELCDRFSVSRKTGYKWLRRADREGWPGVKDRSRKPKNCPWRTPADVEAAIIGARSAHPSWGPVKILEYLEKRRPELTLPAASTTAVKQFPRGACRGQRQLGSSLLEVFEDLHRSPARVGASDPNDGRLDVGRRAPRAVL